MIMANGTYSWSFVTQILRYRQPNQYGVRKAFDVMTSTKPLGTHDSVVFLFVIALYQRNPDMNHKLRNIVSTEIYKIFHLQMLLHTNGK